MHQSIVLVPIYKPTLNAFEQYSVDHSMNSLCNQKVLFIGPQGLDISYYSKRYPNAHFKNYSPHYFESILGYNHLLLSQSFYTEFLDYEFMLVLQTDAIVLRDELDWWCAQPFDYVGAPWPDGLELFVNLGKFEGNKGRRVRATVGNGGFSLRRIHKCIALIKEFPVAVDHFERSGSSEDLFFTFMAPLASDFIMPNEITASRFSLELNPSFYYAINGNQLPMGGHAWWKYDFDFWRNVLPPSPALEALLLTTLN